MNTSPMRHNHPLLMAAAIAIILFCGVGIAALMGWLPNSGGTPSPRSDSPIPSTAATLREGGSQAAAVDYRPGPAAGSSLAPLAPPASPASPAGAYAEGGPSTEAQRTAPDAAAPVVCHSCGVVESVREVSTRAQGSGLGAGAGAVVGGLLGHQIGGGSGRQLATVAGAVGGAVVGNQVEGSMHATRSYTIKVRMDDGRYRSFQRSTPNWQQGERVRVVKGELQRG